MISKLALAIALATTACAPVYSDIEVAAPVAPDPWVAPGVQLVGGWNDPVFWADNAYWWWGDGGWMTWGPTGWVWAPAPAALSIGVRDPWRFRNWGGARDLRGDLRGRWTRPTAAWRGSRAISRPVARPSFRGRR